MTSTTILSGSDDVLTVHHLVVRGSQRDIGRSLAATAREVHGAAAAPFPVDPAVERVRRSWFAAHHPAQLERMHGVADHFGVDPDDPAVALDWLLTFDRPAGCSVAFFPSARTKDGHGLLSRNFDFPTVSLSDLMGLAPRTGERPLASDAWVVEHRPDRGLASVTVAIMDVMGAMDGINEAGLAVALLADNETPEPEPTGGPQVGLAEQQVVRYLLDTCTTVDDALEALRVAKHYYFFTPCHFVVADRSGRSFVWEHSPRRNREVVVSPDPDAAGMLTCTNHLLHRWPDPALLPDDSGPTGTAALTYQRWRTLTDANARGAIVDRNDIREQFAGVRFTAPLVEARTFWHALYDVDDASAEISFFAHDDGGTSVYRPPVRIALED